MSGIRVKVYAAAGFAALLACWAWAGAQTAPSSRVLGTVTSVSVNTLSVKTDAGTTVDITVPENAKILKTAPGQKTLAGAATITLTQIQVGDRVLMLAHGTPPVAAVIIVNTKADLAALQQKQREEWQLHGVGGIVKSVDAAGGTVTILSGAKPLVIHATPSTIIRRYAPDSVKFSDAQTSTLAAIGPGDQIQARGQKNADGTEMTADEIVSGSFRNIAGLITSIDVTAGTFTVKDWMTKKAVVIHVTPDSDVRQLDARMAEMIAARLRTSGGAPADATGGGAGGPGHAQGQGPTPPQNGGAAWQQHQGAGPRGNAGGGNELARVLAESPEIHVADLHKDDAVIIVATSGSPGSATAIRVVAGVRPMLEASASGSQSMFSSAWSLGGGSGSGGGDAGDTGDSGTP
ncbi:MAG: hypothetical protein WCA44_18220 [Acidobacteriaceae bacterium]